MPTIGDIFSAKEQAQTYQPLLLVEFELVDGTFRRYSTHPLSSTYWGNPTSGTYHFNGHEWLPRVLNQELGTTQAMSDLGIDIAPQVSIVLADPDKSIYATDIGIGFKGATVKLYAVMWDAGDRTTGSFSSNLPGPIKFIGTCGSPSFDEKTFTVSATSLLSMSSKQIPPVRIQKRCPWRFPTNQDNRTSGLSDRSSLFYECGYSYGLPGGVGNPQTGTAAFRSCDQTIEACIVRLGDGGALVPIEKDQFGNFTGRFGGSRWIPNQSSGLQRSYLSGKWEEIINPSNEARYGDFAPLVYGPTWLEPLVMGSWADGNYSNFEILLAYGEITKIMKVVVNGTEIPRISDDTDSDHRHSTNSIPSDAVTGTFKNGYWKTINKGQRNGTPNPNPGWGRQGDPYGSMCAIYVSVLKSVAQSGSIPRVQVLLQGSAVAKFSDATTSTYEYSSNPAWILMDVLVKSNWKYSDMNINSFISVAAKCDTQIFYTRMDGTYGNVYNESGAPAYKAYEIGFSLRQRTSASELIRGIRNSAKLTLFFDYDTGKLTLGMEETLAAQQPTPIIGSNYNTPVPSVTPEGVNTTGYVAYHFTSASILRIGNGNDSRSSLQITQKNSQDAPNKVTISFQNRENSYSQDSATIADTEDIARMRQEIVGSFQSIGILTFDHARRVAATWFAKNYRGNPRNDYLGSSIGDTAGTQVFDFETSIKGLHLVVGQICMLSHPVYSITNQLIRIQKIQPSANFETAKIQATFHNDNWYLWSFGQVNQPRYTRHRSAADHPPYVWRAGKESPAPGDALYSQSKKNFGLRSFYEETGEGAAIAKLEISGRVPVDAFPNTPGRPILELLGQGSSGGSLPSDRTYYLSMVAKGYQTTASLETSLLSNICVTTLQPGQESLSFMVNNWPDSPASGCMLFAGLEPFAMSYQRDYTACPTNVYFSGPYNEADYGAPDNAFSRFRWRVRRSIHAGVWGQSVVSASMTGVEISTYPGWGFATNEFAGRELTVFGLTERLELSDDDQPFIPIANYTVASNTSNVVTLSGSGVDLTTVVDGGPLIPGDVVVMGMLPTFGQDAEGLYFEDALWVNNLNDLPNPLTVIDASNTTPIILTFSDIGLYDINPGDIVVCAGVVGNTGSNGGFVAGTCDPNARTVELLSSVGTAPYESGGTAGKQIRGLVDNAETGRIAFIYAGTGEGTSVKIKSNTDTRIYIEGSWPVVPDSTTRITILEPVVQLDVASEQLNNDDFNLDVKYLLDTTNYRRQSIFVQVFTESINGELSSDAASPFRQFFLYGSPGNISDVVREIISTENIVRIAY